jgi:hypothetical protein
MSSLGGIEVKRGIDKNFPQIACVEVLRGGPLLATNERNGALRPATGSYRTASQLTRLYLIMSDNIAIIFLDFQLSRPYDQSIMSDEVPNNPYQTALFAAWEELEKLKEQERQITLRKAQVQQTVSALWLLVFPENEDINNLSLPNAIRMIMRGTQRALKAIEVKSKLEDMGFDMSKFENPMANVSTALRRMVDAEELIYVEDEDQKKKVAPGPELKSVPETATTPANLNALATLYGIKPPGE